MQLLPYEGPPAGMPMFMPILLWILMKTVRLLKFILRTMGGSRIYAGPQAGKEITEAMIRRTIREAILPSRTPGCEFIEPKPIFTLSIVRTVATGTFPETDSPLNG